jgi:hypothetical protein
MRPPNQLGSLPEPTGVRPRHRPEVRAPNAATQPQNSTNPPSLAQLRRPPARLSFFDGLRFQIGHQFLDR